MSRKKKMSMLETKEHRRYLSKRKKYEIAMAERAAAPGAIVRTVAQHKATLAELLASG